MGPLPAREAACCATFHKSHKWHTARRFVPVLWFGTFHGIGRKGEPTGKERKKGARVKTTAPPVLSSTAQKVTWRTITGPNASYSLKPAESLSRCPHARQGVKRLPGASRSLSALISAAYGSGRQLRAPKGKELRAPKGKELRAPKGKELRAPKGKELRAPKGKELRAPKGKELRAPVSYILRQNAALASHAKSTALGAKFSLSC
jgi:hypothetical protein